MKKYIIILNIIAISFVQAQTELLINKNWEIQQYYSILTQSPDDRIVHFSIDNTEITYPDYTGLIYRFNENNNYEAYFNVTPSEITVSTWSFSSNNALIINGRTYEILELTNEKLLISSSTFYIDTPTIQEFPMTNYYEFKNTSTLSLEENVLASNYHFFPNPVKKNLYFTYKEDNNADKIEIYSIDGKKIVAYQLDKVSKEQEVSFENLPRGVYLLKLYDINNHVLQVSKLLKD